ncbi:VOC family protein [Gordonia alkaliphila]|uniref:VOC family protein n=1 Tax=Gordonia alkaliphila TaxID=1053547 RepID=UPI001FF16CD4|nr:VOC family protein [Gordonia alkaliphila]MCK0440747.1 VOC family protein [Gordonia alkaliphila]
MAPDPLQLGDVAVTVAVDDPAAAAAAYDVLVGAGSAGVWAASNGSVRAAAGESAPWAAFAAADVAGATALLGRRGLSLDADGRAESVAAVGITADAGARAGAPTLDHVVYTAPSVDAAIALFAGRLGLDLRLVRQFGDVAQVFFRSASVVVEVLAGSGEQAADFGLWGLAWRVADLDVEHARLTREGLALSEIRVGRKPGTRVATVRERALGTPTILLEQAAR